MRLPTGGYQPERGLSKDAALPNGGSDIVINAEARAIELLKQLGLWPSSHESGGNIDMTLDHSGYNEEGDG